LELFIFILKIKLVFFIFSDATHYSNDNNYRIEDIHSDQDSDNDEMRIPTWAKG